MKLDIVLTPMVCGQIGFHLLHYPAESRDKLGASVLENTQESLALNGTASNIDLDKVLLLQIDDADALVLDIHKEALLNQALESFPDLPSAYAQTFGQRSFGDTLPWREAP